MHECLWWLDAQPQSRCTQADVIPYAWFSYASVEFAYASPVHVQVVIVWRQGRGWCCDLCACFLSNLHWQLHDNGSGTRACAGSVPVTQCCSGSARGAALAATGEGQLAATAQATARCTQCVIHILQNHVRACEKGGARLAAIAANALTACLAPVAVRALQGLRFAQLSPISALQCEFQRSRTCASGGSYCRRAIVDAASTELPAAPYAAPPLAHC